MSESLTTQKPRRGNQGATSTHCRLLNSLVPLVGQVNSELVGSLRNTGRMIRELYAIFKVQFNTQSRNTFTFCVFSQLPESQNVLGRIAECLEIAVLARIAELQFLEIKIVSAVTWISLSIKFAVLRRQ